MNQLDEGLLDKDKNHTMAVDSQELQECRLVVHYPHSLVHKILHSFDLIDRGHSFGMSLFHRQPPFELTEQPEKGTCERTPYQALKLMARSVDFVAKSSSFAPQFCPQYSPTP